MRADDQAKMQATVAACLEYLALASHPSPLAQLAREALVRELNQLQIQIGRGLHLVSRREARERDSPPLFADVLDPATAHLPPPPVDTAPQLAHVWTAKQLADAAALLPDGLFAGHWFDRVGQQVAAREHVGVSLLRALEANGVVEPLAVNQQGEEDLRGPFLRFRKV
jgi:hypothetical protein